MVFRKQRTLLLCPEVWQAHGDFESTSVPALCVNTVLCATHFVRCMLAFMMNISVRTSADPEARVLQSVTLVEMQTIYRVVKSA